MTEHTIPLSAIARTMPIDLDALARDRGTHSSFGPSSSHMWAFCPGSLIPNLMAIDNAGYDAAYGTVAHDVTDEWRKTGKKPRHRLGTTVFVEKSSDWWGFFVDIDVDMLDHCQTCVDSVSLEPGIHFYERRVYFSKVTPIPEQGGTADCMILQPASVRRGRRLGAKLIVVDWKFGTGYQVFAKDNTQGLMYALGAFYEFDIDYDVLEIEIRIEQPRLAHSDSWTITREELLEFEAWITERAHAAWKLDAPRIAGPKQCRFCKVKDDCAANAKLQIDLTAGAFVNLDAPADEAEMREFRAGLDIGMVARPADLNVLTLDQMATLYQYRAVVDNWWKQLEIKIKDAADSGKRVPGMKLVEGRSNRHFANQADAVKALVAHGVPRGKVVKTVVCSPAQAEELLREAGHRRMNIPKLLDGLIARSPGKPSLVPMSDKRPELADITEAAFRDLDQP